MISSVMQALEPLFAFLSSFFAIPWDAWDMVKEIVRSTVSLNGGTAVEPMETDGVLDICGASKDEGSKTS